MYTITCLDNVVLKNHNHFSNFIIEPLESGQGITLGNALRRALFSEIYSYKIGSVQLNDIKNEYSLTTILREDISEFFLNLKKIQFRESYLLYEKLKSVSNYIIPAFCNIKGPKIITAGMLNLPKNLITILNPEQYLCTLVKESNFYCEFEIYKGKGFQNNIENLKNYSEKKLKNSNKIFLDINFNPLQKVNFKVKLIHDSNGFLKESLFIEILTNGTKSPKRCLFEALKCLLDLFYPLLMNNKFLVFNSQFSKIYFENK